MDVFFKPDVELYIPLLFDLTKGKNLIIYGCNSDSEQFCNRIGVKPLYFVDDEPDITEFLGTPVLNVFDLIYMNRDKIIIAIIKPKTTRDLINRTMFSCNLLNGEHYRYITPTSGVVAVTRDVTLGHSRKYDKLEGFEVYGENTEGIKIVALGGSTTDPIVSPGHSWPLKLYEMLDAKGINAQVFNGGFASYSSSVELLKLIRDTILLEPDIVISYGSCNDFFYVDHQPEHNRYMRPFIHHDQETIFRWISEQRGEDVLWGLHNEKDIARVWVDNMRMMHSICNEFGAEFLGLLQPTPFNNGNPDDFVLSDIAVQYKAASLLGLSIYHNSFRFFEYIDKAEQYIHNIPYIYSLRNLFENVEDIYYDLAHVTQKGNYLIAAHIYNILVSSGILAKKGAAI